MEDPDRYVRFEYRGRSFRLWEWEFRKHPDSSRCSLRCAQVGGHYEFPVTLGAFAEGDGRAEALAKAVRRIVEMVDRSARPVPPDLPIRFPPGRLAAALDARGGDRNETARGDLARYYALLDAELLGVALTEREALFVVETANGRWPTDVWNGEWFAADVEFVISDGGLADEPAVDGAALAAMLRPLTPAQALALREYGLSGDLAADGAALAAKLRALTPAQALALADAVDRFWVAARRGRQDRAALLREVGLVR